VTARERSPSLDPADPWLEKVTDADVVDPLSKPARDERTYLIFANLLLFCVVHVGLVPTKISVLGIEGGALSRSNIVLLAWIVFLFYFISFSFMVGSEFRAWSTKLQTLRERRRLRREFYLEKHLDRVPGNLSLSVCDPGDQREIENVQGAIVTMHNLTEQKEWTEYVRMYRVRMWLDGFLPIGISLCNLVFSALKGALP
jgi:hypothetical protein